MRVINKKEGSTVLIILACVLSVVLISLVIGAVYISVSSEKTNKNLDSDENNLKDTQIKDEDVASDTPEEVKKLDAAQGLIFEKEIRINDSYNIKTPIVNLTTRYATKVNSEVEEKYRACSGGKYIVYSYYMYVDLLSLILDNNLGGGLHSYDIYNINIETGKEIKNRDLLKKMNMSEQDFIKKVKEACIKQVDKNLEGYQETYTDEKYQIALSKTLKEAENALDKKIYIDHTGKLYVILNLTLPNDNKVEQIIEVLKLNYM